MHRSSKITVLLSFYLFSFFHTVCVWSPHVSFPLFLPFVNQHNIFSIHLHLFALFNACRALNSLTNKTFCVHSFTLLHPFLPLRVVTGSCLPLRWRWRRWVSWKKDSTPAWPIILLWSHSTRSAPSASLYFLVREDFTRTRPVVLCTDWTWRGLTPLHYSKKCFRFSL